MTSNWNVSRKVVTFAGSVSLNTSIMMKTVFAVLLAFMSMTIQGQTYSSLWKQAEEAERKDLPRTQYDVLMKIVNKAQKEGEYGQLMAAELAGSRVMTGIAPDSLQPAVERMEARQRATSDKALATVYAVILKKIYADNEQLKPQDDLTVTLDEETCERLAAVKAADYKPLTVIGRNSSIFGDDMLSVVGYELNDFRPLHNYYTKVGNRQAMLMTALQIARQGCPQGQVKYAQASYIHTLDSLIACYSDVPEVAEVAIDRYEYMTAHTDATADEQWAYLNDAISRWGSYNRTNELRNAQRNMVARQYNAELETRVAMPGQEQKLKLTDIRNIERLDYRVYRVDVRGDTRLNPEDEKDYKKLKPLIAKKDEYSGTLSCLGHKEYELFEDSLPLPALPEGVYLIEMESVPATNVSRRLYFVSNVRMMVEEQPDKCLRYVVVDALEGQPIQGATLELKGYANGHSNQLIATLKTDAKGEATYQYDKNRPTGMFAYTSTDKACPPKNHYATFSYYENERRMVQTQLMTDRAVYRPGQTVHVAAINYEVTNGIEQKALEGSRLKLTLRDTNHKVVAEQTLTTDKYGSCATEFTLPSSGLTGWFSIQTNNGSCSFRVEEYKRPTFEVKFDDFKEDYKDGDTITVRAVARSYAGVPVQGAKVKYSVERRRALWWWSYSSYWNVEAIGEAIEDDEVAFGETVTDADGSFTVQMPMVLPKTDYPMFYTFVCEADITDQGGETHQGKISLPLGNRKTVLSCDLPRQIRSDKMPKLTFHLRNAAGNDIDAEVRYRISEGKWQTANTNSPLPIAKSSLKSGRYQLEAICKDDTLKQDFVVFSLDDKRPAAETVDWFYQSHAQFPNDGSPVTIQVGSSAKDVHIVYSIISGNRVIESGSVERSNELINHKLTYKEEYGNGVLLNFAWMKQGRYYSHTATIQRPLPDKRLQLQWQTFRDRLTPGQQEEWSLTVMKPDGTPADALLMATLYDKSLDQINAHHWSFSPYQYVPLPSTHWQYGYWGRLILSGYKRQGSLDVAPLRFSHFDYSLFPQQWSGRMMRLGNARVRGMAKAAMAVDEMVMEEAAPMMVEREVAVGAQKANSLADAADQKAISLTDAVDEGAEEMPEVQLRENLQETAFFYPQLTTDANGLVTMKFTLPESLTTWRFMGFAHTSDLCYGTIEGEAVAKKDLMVQPNMPRFLREGDLATISSRVINTSEGDLSGTAYLTLIDPDTEKTLYTQKVPFSVKAGETTSVQFTIDNSLQAKRASSSAQFTIHNSLLIAKVAAATETFSDGEQHYLPILPNRERVTVTVPFTQNEPGTKTIDLTQLFNAPSGATGGAKLTVEYTNNPAWLMIQALPAVGHPNDDCAICQGASLYANSIGKYILDQIPQAKTVFEQWKREKGTETSLHSQLQKNQELKDLLLNETPWVADADRETEQRQRLADFFDENLMQQRLQSALVKLEKLQRGDGSWSWWPDMPGSIYMTISVTEMMVRQNTMMGEQAETKQMLKNAIKFLGKEMVDMVKEMKKWEKKGYRQYFPSFTALQWLYICKLDGRQLPKDVTEANDYLIKLLKKETKNQSIYEKAMSAIILDSPLYIKSLKEYTVYKEEMGRYYDTPRAGYSWRDYRIPTQVAAIEAIQRLTPDDQQTLDEMRRWLLQEKRTQAWDTPLNSVDAVYAFIGTKSAMSSPLSPMGPMTILKLDNQPLETPKATAGIGYVKTAQPYHGEKTFTATKESEGTSWGAVYAQFIQATGDIKDQASGVSVKRELMIGKDKEQHVLRVGESVKVGDRVTVRLTIQSERDLDFVQLQDKRAACMEPVSQLSGYDWHLGCYVTPRDNVTNYYFDRLPKGERVVETEYYIDRAGQYETGTCTIQCAYASEYRGTTHSQTIKVE